MKTKHILTALALPAMFAACTADDIVSVENGLQQAERAKLSKDFVLNTNNEVESRYAVEGSADLKFTFAKGDKIGAAIVDEFLGYTATDTYDPEDPTTWNIKYVLAGNNPFAYDGVSSWTSESELGVGNYIFTYPYNAKDNNRGAVKWELPRVQQYDANDPNAIIEANNKSISAAVLYEGQTEASVSLKNLYTYPKFNLVFDNGEDITKITKVVLKYENAIMYKGGFDHKKVVALFGNDYEKYAALATNEDELWGVKAGEVYNEKKHTLNWDAVQTSDLILANDGNSYAQFDVTNFLIVEMDQKVSKVANTDNKTASVRLMMPSVADFTTESNITMYVVTDNGTYAQELNADACAFKATTSDDAKKQALWRNKSYTLTINGGWNPEGIEDLGNIVTTAADWNKLVDLYGNAEKFNGEGTNGTLPISILSEDFALAKDLKMPKVAVFEIATPVSVEGAVTLSNVKAATVNVNEGAVLTTSKTFEATTVNVKAGGELKFAQVLNDDEEVVAYTKVTTVKNEGKVTVLAGTEATFALKNEKKASELVVEAAASRAAEGAAIANITGYNNGKIVNNGIINAGTFENKTVTEAAGYEYDTKEGWDGYPTITNKGTFNAVGVVLNSTESVFENEKVLSSNHNSPAEFTNLGTLKIADAASTFIDANATSSTAKGTIELATLTPANFTIFDASTADKYSATERGTIKYIVTGKGTTVDLTGSPVNYLVAESGIKLTKSYNYTATGATTATYVALPTLVLTKGGNVEIAASTDTATPAAVSEMQIKAGEVTVVNHINSVGSIKIAKDASLIVPASAKLTIAAYTDIAGIDDKKGNVQVNGTLVVTGATGDASGNLTSANVTTGNSMITLGKEGVAYAGNKDNSAATAKQTVYDNVVNRYWSDIVGDASNITDGYYNYNPYDTQIMGKVLEGWIAGGDNQQKAYATAIFKDFGFIKADGTFDTSWSNLAGDTDKEIKAIAAKLTDNDNFTAAIAAKILTLTGDDLKALKAEFIVKNAKEVNVINNYTPTNVSILFASEDAAMTEYYKSLINNQSNVAKYVNIWQFTSDIKTAFNNSTDSEYQYVWVDCDLHQVMQIVKLYTGAEWAAMLGVTASINTDKIDDIKYILKQVSMSSSTADPIVDLKALNFYPASQDWKYVDGQVVKCKLAIAEK